ncbi:DUF2284 domain-containing protein, partial [Chloroflexota bacterium]
RRIGDMTVENTGKKATKKDDSPISVYEPIHPLPEEKELFEDLEIYRQMILDMGAEEALIIRAADFPQDIRVWWKCQIPRCTASGANPYCPPAWQTPWEHAKQMKNSYKYCLVFKVTRPPEFWTGTTLWTRESNAALSKYLTPEEREKAQKKLQDYVAWQKEYKKTPFKDRVHGTASIGPVIVRQARKDGHQFAVTFGVGACQYHRCAEYGAKCVALSTGYCRFPLKVSPEGSAALYQDFSALSGKLGWPSWVAGHSIQPEDVSDEVQYYQAGSILIE